MNRIHQNGPWLLSSTADSKAIGSILLSRNVKRYAKFVVTVDTELTSLNVLNFALLIEIAIADPSSPVLTTTTKNILKRFPSWMAMYQDTLDQATPDLYIPVSTSAKFINSIVGENLDSFSREIDSFRLNSYIETADEDQLAWMYSSKNVINTFNKVIGNNVELIRADNLVDFFKAKSDDYVFYHDPASREIITLKQYATLELKSINSPTTISLTQIPVQRFNWFDEFGAMVGLSRLYLESNTSFKARILDVFKNPNAADIESFKKVLRRELNLWKAFGVEPSSDYVGATPEILEISDIEYSTPYFTADGNPTDSFKKLVEDFNIKYPNNWGYFRFDDTLWDYAGLGSQGVGRIRSRYYDEDINIPYYQPGVGDLSDARLVIQNAEATPKFFETTITASGKRKTGTTISYSPVLMDYEYYGSYEITEYDNPAATVNLTLEFDATPHGSYATPITFFAPVTLYPKNNFSPSSSASPEYNALEIFDTEGYVSSKHTVLEKDTLKGYKDSTKTTNPTRLDLTKLLNLKIKNGKWNGSTYATPNSDNFTAKFSHRNAILVSSSSLLSATPNFNQNTQLQYVSSLYTAKQVTKNTAVQKSSIQINNVATPPSAYSIDHNRIIENIVMPIGATPKYIYIENIKPSDTYGGISYYSEIDEDVFIPSSPNIVLNYYGSNLATPISNSQIGSTQITSGHATANYYFTKIQYPYSGTPNSLTVSTANTSLYPFNLITWEPFTVTSSTPISGYIDESGIVLYDAKQGEYIPGNNTNQILVPELTRESFGISGATKFDYYFENINVVDPADLNISIWSEQKIVNPFLNRTYVLENANIPAIIGNSNYTTKSLSYPNNSIVESYDSERNTTVFTNFIVRGKLYDSKLDASIHTGWLHVGKEEYYVYAKPIKESFTGKLKTITLSSVTKQGAPVKVAVYPVGSTPEYNYIEIGFADESTPREFGFYNLEILQPKFNNTFHLGYKGVYDVSITDNYTGELIYENLSTDESYIDIPVTEYSFVKNRDYTIRYRVKDSYYINNVLEGSNYYSNIVFDATPSATMNYDITYESSLFENATPVSLNFGQTSSLLEEGYIIVTDKEYDFDTVKTIVSPGYVLADGLDFMTITLIALDVNGNPKANETFVLTSAVLNFDHSTVTTNSEGYALVNATYDGTVPTKGITSGTFSITGTTNSYTKNVDFDIISYKTFDSKLRAIANPNTINADNVSSVYITGTLNTAGTPQANKKVYWRKSRNMYSALNSVVYSTSSVEPGASNTSGMVTTDENGKFQIGPFTAQPRTDSGYWFVVVDSEVSSTATATPSATVGDITYWYESYDNIDYNYVTGIKFPDVINSLSANSLDLYATPSFLNSYYRDDLVIPTHSTPRWTPPVWLPISRYEQYQAGFFGATPYGIENITNIKNDYED